MPSYTGNECPACGKVFEEGDDIVVCPICGSPHHRECYKSLGHCGNEALHGQDQQWEPNPAVFTDDAPPATVVCGQCGHPNPTGNFFCQHCGQRIGAEAPGQPQPNENSSANPFLNFIQANIDYSQVLGDGVTVKEACDYVGPNNVPFALRFRALSQRTNMSFNWSAFFFGFYYCFYRKMYKMGAILLGLFVVSVLPSGYYSAIAIGDILAAGGALTFPIPFVVEGAGYQGLLMASAFSRMISLAATLYCGFFFNRNYYANMLKKVRMVRDTGHFSTGSQEYSYALSRTGGVSMGAVLALISAVIAAYMIYGFVASYLILL